MADTLGNSEITWKIRQPAKVIPRTLNFIYGLAEDFAGKPFSLCHWAAIRSAQKANPGWVTHFHYKFEPSGRYWEAIRPTLQLHRIEPPETVHGRPIPHPAHKCDWLRLQLLHEHGGVYLDLDTITCRPFNFNELIVDTTYESVMARESTGTEFVGLCNAFIASVPGSAFLQEWMNKFTGFRSTGHDSFWNESAVKWPAQVAAENPGLCKILDESTWFVPDWSLGGILAMFVENKHSTLSKTAYGHHLWESFGWRYLKNITPENYREQSTTYTTLLEELLADEIKDVFLSP